MFTGFFPGHKLPSEKKVRSLQSGWNLTPIHYRRPERPLSVAAQLRPDEPAPAFGTAVRRGSSLHREHDGSAAQAWPAPQEMLNSRCRRTAFSIYGRSHSARLADTAAEFSRLPRDRYGSWPSAAIGRGRVALWTKRTFSKWGKVYSRFFSTGRSWQKMTADTLRAISQAVPSSRLHCPLWRQYHTSVHVAASGHRRGAKGVLGSKMFFRPRSFSRE